MTIVTSTLFKTIKIAFLFYRFFVLEMITWWTCACGSVKHACHIETVRGLTNGGKKKTAQTLPEPFPRHFSHLLIHILLDHTRIFPTSNPPCCWISSQHGSDSTPHCFPVPMMNRFPGSLCCSTFHLLRHRPPSLSDERRPQSPLCLPIHLA